MRSFNKKEITEVTFHMPSCQTFIWVHLAKSPLHMVKSIAEYACGLQKHTGSVLSLARLRFVMVPVDCDPMTMMAKVGVGRHVMWQLAVHVTMLALPSVFASSIPHHLYLISFPI